jgi:L,D-transpeptidase YcbB
MKHAPLLLTCAASLLAFNSRAPIDPAPADRAPAERAGRAATQRAAAPRVTPDSTLKAIVAAGRLSDLRWPDFSDFDARVRTFYESTDYSLAWVRDNKATPQALVMIDELRDASRRGLTPEDYDASRWAERLTRLGDPTTAARFDAALTVCVMRFVSDLRVGRVNPKDVRFALREKTTTYDLPQFVRQDLVNGQDVKAEVESVEPPFPGYKATEAALERYTDLARQDDGGRLPVPSKTLDPGSPYTGVPRLTRLLRLVGDLGGDAVVPDTDVYQEPLVDAVKRFQSRHGLSPDGRLGARTLNELNTPLSARVEQLKLTLERWRWLPQEFPQPPVVVNIPEFRLAAFEGPGKIALSMNVIVGKAYRHETPVFDEEMRYVVFRPYWNVPPSIQRSEIVPAIRKDRNYVARNGYEVTTQAGKVVTSGKIDDDVLAQLSRGTLLIRQKPGPTNALGLVKLMFPNKYNVYLHSTPTQQLFSEARRDFSHGCIRVEKPDDLAAWVLRDNPGWTLDKVRAAMETGKNDVRVDLAKPIPVLILYGTAVAESDGSIDFFEDIYGYDRVLEKALAKGYPFRR